MSKKIRLDKETRKLIESISDVVKYRKGKFKFKAKGKKTVKRIKRSCVHWFFTKKISPAVEKHPENPMNWRCKICGASFPIRPGTLQEYREMTNNVISIVNQLQFWSIKMGGDADDTKLFIRLKNDLVKLKRAEKTILNQVNKRQAFESNKNREDGSISQFDDYNGFSYR